MRFNGYVGVGVAPACPRNRGLRRKWSRKSGRKNVGRHTVCNQSVSYSVTCMKCKMPNEMRRWQRFFAWASVPICMRDTDRRAIGLRPTVPNRRKNH